MLRPRSWPGQPDSNQTASGKPGAVQVVIGVLPIMLGGNPGDGWQYPTPGAMLVAGSALLLVLRPLRGLPGPVVALGVATAVHHGLLASGVPVGPEVSKLLSPAALASEIGAGWSALALSPPPLSRILPGAATIALLATIETLAAAAALRETSGRRTEYGRDLLGAGTGMLAGAGLGGVPASALTVPTMTAWLAGGRTRATQVAGATVPFALLLLGAPLLSELPLAGLAAVLAGAVLRLVELPLAPVVAGALPNRRWTDATISCAVVAAAVVFGLLAAVGIGALVSVVVFTSAMARTPIRRAYRNPTGRSQMRRPIELELRLRKEGDAIALLELEGPIFFGSADHVLNRVEAEFAAGASVVALEMSRITHVDMSGGRRLLEACAVAPGRVLIAPMHAGGRVASEFGELGLAGSLPQAAVCSDVASAVELAETIVLGRTRGLRAADRPVCASDALIGIGLPADCVAPIIALSTEVRFPDGGMILKAGDASEAAYLLLSGEVLISLGAGDGKPAARLAVLAPGVLFGETALLGQSRRTADATARGDVVCLRINGADIAQLRENSPEIAWRFLATVARQLAIHLRTANVTIAKFEA